MCPQQVEELLLVRSKLLEQMKEMEQKGLSCHGCSAPCCTFHHNSMRISKNEGLAIIKYLVSQKIDLRQVEKNCRSAIVEFRLDKDIFLKTGARLRRHYTCPFFTNNELGCAIPAEHKPLGCLAFNPSNAQEKGQSCRSISYPPVTDNEKLEIPTMIVKVLENFLGVL